VDCHFSYNSAVYAGGAVCLSIPGIDVLFSNCDFNYTTTQSSQGLIIISHLIAVLLSHYKFPLFLLFITEGVGGALSLLQAGSTMIEECTFYANTAVGTLSSAGLSVGPLFQESIQAGLFIYSSLFQNNTNLLGAGAVIVSSSHAKLIFQHCDFLQNSGLTTGALQSTAEMEISFCTFESNFVLPNGSSVASPPSFFSSSPLSSLQTPNFAFQAGAISTATNLVVVGR
jgi:hypothetical protein